MSNALLAVTASILLLVALAQSWAIVAVLSAPEGPVAKIIPGSRELIRSHIDYLMMAQFLFVLYGLFRLLSIQPSIWLVVLTCFGSFFNPFAFFLRAMYPAWLEAPPKPYTVLITTSCIATTVGYATIAVILARAALAGV